METTIMGYIGIIGLYRGNRVIMEKKMETTGITGVIGIIIGVLIIRLVVVLNDVLVSRFPERGTSQFEV